MRAADGEMRAWKPLIPPAIWFGCLSLLYAVATAACARIIAPDGIVQAIAPWLVLAASIAALLWIAIFGVAVRHDDSGPPFLTLLSRLLSVLALIATVWLLFPLAMLPVCAVN